MKSKTTASTKEVKKESPKPKTTSKITDKVKKEVKKPEKERISPIKTAVKKSQNMSDALLNPDAKSEIESEQKQEKLSFISKDMSGVSLNKLPQVSYIKPESILIEKPKNSRVIYLKIKELAEDISKNGIKKPIEVIELPEDSSPFVSEYQFRNLEGYRRLTAVQYCKDHNMDLSKLEVIPAFIFPEGSVSAKDEITNHITNNTGESYTPLDLGKAYFDLMSEHNMSKREIAAEVGKTEALVGQYIALYEICEKAPKLKEYIEEGEVTPFTIIGLLTKTKDALEITRTIAEGIIRRRALGKTKVTPAILQSIPIKKTTVAKIKGGTENKSVGISASPELPASNIITFNPGQLSNSDVNADVNKALNDTNNDSDVSHESKLTEVDNKPYNNTFNSYDEEEEEKKFTEAMNDVMMPPVQFNTESKAIIEDVIEGLAQNIFNSTELLSTTGYNIQLNYEEVLEKVSNFYQDIIAKSPVMV